jgi:MFS family permease
MQAIATAELPSRISHEKVLVVFGGLEHLSWVVTAYLLAQTIVTPIYGKLGDLYGRKRVLQSAIIIFLIGSALCGLSQSMTRVRFRRATCGGTDSAATSLSYP